MLDNIDGSRNLASDSRQKINPPCENGKSLAKANHVHERGCECVIRPWCPGDEVGAWHVLKDGSFSNVPVSFMLLMKKRGMIAVLCAVGAGVFGYTGDFCAGLLIVGLQICLVYSALWMVALYYVYGPPLWDMKKVSESYFQNDDSRFWVAVLDGKIVGTIAIVRQGEPSRNINNSDCQNKRLKVAWLRRMAVARECRKKGVAKALVRTAVNFCMSRGYDKVELITTDVHRAAIKLYENCGFSCRSYRPYQYFKGFLKIWTYEYELELTS